MAFLVLMSSFGFRILVRVPSASKFCPHEPDLAQQKLIVVYDNFVPGDPGSWFAVLYAFVVIPTSSPTLRVESQQSLAFLV